MRDLLRTLNKCSLELPDRLKAQGIVPCVLVFIGFCVILALAPELGAFVFKSILKPLVSALRLSP